MKKDFNLTKLFYSFAIAFSVVTLSSCNNDDNSPLPPPSTNDVAGTYNGKVLITQVTPATVKENAGEAPQGQDVNATVKNDTVFFDKLPVTELITSIVGDKDKAEAIVKAIGDVKYRLQAGSQYREGQHLPCFRSETVDPSTACSRRRPGRTDCYRNHFVSGQRQLCLQEKSVEVEAQRR